MVRSTNTKISKLKTKTSKIITLRRQVQREVRGHPDTEENDKLSRLLFLRHSLSQHPSLWFKL